LSKKPTISASIIGTDASRLQGDTDGEASARSSFSESERRDSIFRADLLRQGPHVGENISLFLLAQVFT
jgi:hypothetical protein